MVDLRSRLENKLVRQPNGCLEFMGSRRGRSYGGIWVDGRIQQAHRVAWALSNGDPGDLHVLHKCDNPPCCNLDHLFLGTPKDNADDRNAKGRSNNVSGERQGRSKLTEQNVRDIRWLWSYGEPSQAEIGALFGITQSQVSKIVRRMEWSDVA